MTSPYEVFLERLLLRKKEELKAIMKSKSAKGKMGRVVADIAKLEAQLRSYREGLKMLRRAELSKPR